MPIRPTRPPPNTRATLEFASSRPSSAAASAYTGRTPELEPQNTQSRRICRTGCIFSMAMAVTGLKTRHYRLAQTRREPLGQGEAAEKQGDVDCVAGEGVPEKRHAGEVAHCEAPAGARIAVQEGPDAEVGDQEKLQSAEERSAGDAWHDVFFRGRRGSWLGLSLRSRGRAKARPCDGSADEDAEEKTGVNQRAQLVETDNGIGGEHHQKRKEEGQAAVAHHGAGKQGDRADGSEVPGMLGEAQGG